MIRRHPILFFLLFLICGAVAFGIYKVRQPKPLEVRTARVENAEELLSLVNATGEIRAHDMVDIQAEVSGVIVELPIVEGQQVARGDLLLKIDPIQTTTERTGAQAERAGAMAELKRIDAMIATARANVNRLENEIKSAQADIEEAEINSRRDENDLKRQNDLYKTKTISIGEFEIVEARTRISKQRVDSAKARFQQVQALLVAGQSNVQEQLAMKSAAQQALAVREAQLERAEDLVNKVTIASPLTGVVVRLNVSIGERAVPGIQSNPEATLMTLADMARLEAELKVDETDIVRLQLGQKATVKVDALPDLPMQGIVSEIGSAPIQASSLTSSSSAEGKDFKAVIVIANPSPQLRIGLTCEADITIETRHNVLAIPIQAMTMREVDVDADGKYFAPPKPAKNDKPAKPTDPAAPPAAGGPKRKELRGVFVMDEEGRARFKPIEIGIMGESKVEVTSGLTEGDRVIIGPLTSLRQLAEWTLVAEQPAQSFGAP